MISSETIKKLHELNCEDVARRLGLEVNMHQAHCFMHQKGPALPLRTIYGNVLLAIKVGMLSLWWKKNVIFRL